jgi:KTSC domain
MTLIYLNSSFIEAVSYDGHTLTVLFLDGNSADHHEVPYGVFHGLIRAESPGGFYNRHIKWKYP